MSVIQKKKAEFVAFLPHASLDFILADIKHRIGGIVHFFVNIHHFCK